MVRSSGSQGCLEPFVKRKTLKGPHLPAPQVAWPGQAGWLVCFPDGAACVDRAVPVGPVCQWSSSGLIAISLVICSGLVCGSWWFSLWSVLTLLLVVVFSVVCGALVCGSWWFSLWPVVVLSLVCGALFCPLWWFIPWSVVV